MITASINKDIFQWWVHALKKKFKILSYFGHNFFKILHYQALSYDGESYDQIIHGSWQDLTIKIFTEDGRLAFACKVSIIDIAFKEKPDEQWDQT